MNGTETLKPLDDFEAALWEKYKENGINFTVSAIYHDTLSNHYNVGKTYGSSVIRDANMHHYDIDEFYDQYARSYGSGFSSMYDFSDKSGESYHSDILEQLDILEEKGCNLLRELGEFSAKTAEFFNDASTLVIDTEKAFGDMNVLAGNVAKTKVNTLIDVSAKFDEKLAALRLKISENKVH